MKQTKFLPFLLVLYFQSFGGGFQINTMGQRALSMGGSLTALSLDASVTFFNPGGMSFLKNNSIMIGTTAIMPKTAFLSALDGKQVDMESQIFFPFYAYGTYHINEKISAGISINTPFGLGTKWNDEWEGRYITQEAKLKTIYFQPTLSYKVSEKFAIGAGVVFTTGKAELKKATPIQSSSSSFGTGTLKGSANGFGFSVGAFISLIKNITGCFLS
ncbi:MAG: outer membrane protein transport protein [Bacteroidetes bacterium]|nr:outer membrane protein transport protein [Bacteroidota bacterium]